MSSRGNLIVISAPSGSGKTSLANAALERVPQLRFSVSHTTRRPRGGERDGVEYFFVTDPRFESMIEKGDFLEYAHVYDHYYGTSRSFVESERAAGFDVLLDIDVQGALKVKAQVPEALMIFVFPPSLEILERRLRNRRLDDPEAIEKRLRIARDEIHAYREYRYLIINESIDESLNELESIILAARCRLEHRRAQAEEIVRTFR